MSQMVGKPVRVQFMRWDEHGWDSSAPPRTRRRPAGIDAAGNIVAYDYTACMMPFGDGPDAGVGPGRHDDRHRPRELRLGTAHVAGGSTAATRLAPAPDRDVRCGISTPCRHRRVLAKTQAALQRHRSRSARCAHRPAPQSCFASRADRGRARACGGAWTRITFRRANIDRRTPLWPAVAVGRGRLDARSGVEAEGRQLGRADGRRQDRPWVSPSPATTRLMSDAARPSSPTWQVNIKTGKIAVKHIVRSPRTTGSSVNPEAGREPDERHALIQRRHAARMLEQVTFNKRPRHEPRLGLVPDPPLQRIHRR